MKSGKKIFLGTILSLIVLFTLTGCFEKTPLSVDEFISKAETYGLKAEDQTDDYLEENRITKYAVATSDKDWKIEFFEFSDVDNCKKLFESAKSEIESSKAAVSSVSEVNISNHQKYLQTSNGYFFAVSRIDKTLVYIETKAANKDYVKAFLKTINY